MASVQNCAVVSTRRRPSSYIAEKKSVNILTVGGQLKPREQAALEKLPSGAEMIARGSTLSDFSNLSEEDWNNIEVIVVAGHAAKSVEDVVIKAKGLKWIHTLSAGVNNLTAPEIQSLDIPITNSKGVFSHSLAEYALFACNYFAKNCPRLLESKNLKKWDVFEVEELRDCTMGIIGLGDIGFSTAKIAKAFGMNIIGVRRNLELTPEEKLVVDQVYTPNEITKVMGMSDYIVAALPLTERTSKLIDSTCIEAMQSHAVFINIGRGPTVDEEALIKALQNKKIRGAALDVFEVEPLPQTSPLYELENVLISSHNADKTSHFILDSVARFTSLLEDYINGEELGSIVNIKEGY
eukprot:g7505.t1